MDCEKVFDAIEHILRILDWYNPIIDPNSPAMAEAEKHIQIIRQNGPPCETQLASLSSWLRIFFCEPQHSNIIRPAHPQDREAWERMKGVKRNAVEDLDAIEALTRSAQEQKSAVHQK